MSYFPLIRLAQSASFARATQLLTFPKPQSVFTLCLGLTLALFQPAHSALNKAVIDWGLNTNGELGDGTTTNRNVPTDVTISGVLNGKTVISIAAGTNHSFALCSDGTVAAWGLSAYGQLGTPSNGQNAQTLPIDISHNGDLNDKTVTALAGGNLHSLALCSDGTVASWGDNYSGQLGDSTNTAHRLPTSIAGSGALAGKFVTQIRAFGNNSMALCSDGTVVGWGINSGGELGDGTTTKRNAPVNVTTSGVLFGKTVSQITLGIAAYALCTDGTLAAWGSNSSGSLGDGTNIDRLTPVDITNSGALSGKTITKIVSGSGHTLALCSDGTLVAWGFNGSGQLGDGTTTIRTVPTDITGSGALSSKTVTVIAAGWNDSVAVCSDGTVATWGYNTYGQLGDGTTTNHSLPVAITHNGALDGKAITAIVASSGYGPCGHILALASTAPETGKPTVFINSPTTNQKILISNLTGDIISGGALDNVGVAGVKVRLSRKRGTTNYFWNGSEFVPTQTLLNATLNSPGSAYVTWTLNGQLPPADKLDSGLYSLQVSASDTSNNKSDYANTTFTLGTDFTAPTLAITSPTANQKVLIANFTGDAVSGTATDDQIVSAVKIRLSRKRGTTNYYWNGSDFVPTSSVVDATVSGATWTLGAQTPAANKLDTGAYQVEAYALDAGGNKSATQKCAFSLSTDFLAPSVVITTPAQSQRVDINAFSAGTISGTASDDQGVTQIKIKLQRLRGTIYQYWNGTAFTPTATLVDATVTNTGGTNVTWSLDAPIPASQLDSGSYTTYATAYDAAGNSKTSSSRSFLVTGTASPAPVSAPSSSHGS